MLLCVLPLHGIAQQPLHTVRGIILDKETSEPLFGANVALENTEGKIYSALADDKGLFSIAKVPEGIYTVKALFIGYQPYVLKGLRVQDEGSAFISVKLAASAAQINEVEVRENRNRDNEPVNSMAVISARSFTTEESEKVAASLGDPSRLALSFAGVRGQSDILNGIVVRGNAPKGVLWRIDGVEVPSPNHFTQEGYGAGAVCMVSGQVIGTSDFYTGAFPAEYGNAMSAVFDIKMRKGDTQKHHFFFQAGMMGLEGGMEGPFVKGKSPSYLINYRYSTLAVFEKIGFDIGNTITSYQDLAVKLNFPTKKAGTFSVFSVAGKSAINISEENKKKREEKLKTYEMGLWGVSHLYPFNERTVLKTTLLFAGNREKLYKDEFFYRTNALRPDYRLNNSNMYFRPAVQLDTRFSARSSLRSGIISSSLSFGLNDLFDASRNTSRYEADGHTYTLQAYSQWKYALTEKWTLNTGLHFFFFGLNHHFSFEPRAALAYKINEKHALAFAAGLHSRMEALANYMVYDPWQEKRPNESLDYTKSVQTGVSYEFIPIEHLKLKSEIYFQYLYDVPISTDEGSSFSMLNFQDRYVTMPLVNGGTGMNYGVEFTVEKSFAKNYYILANGSLFESKYYAADGIWRNSRYNTNFITSLTAGKDLNFGKTRQWTLGVNSRALWAGGERTEESQFEEQISNYFRIDLRASIARQREHVKWTLAVDIQNANNRKNETTLHEIDPTGILPVLSFRVEL